MIVITRRGGEGKGKNYREFLISSVGDVSNLPTSIPDTNGAVAEPGSIAFLDDATKVYMLGTDDVWREV